MSQLILEHGVNRNDRRFTPVVSVYQALEILRGYPKDSGAYGVLRRNGVAIKGWRRERNTGAGASQPRIS